MPTEKAGLPILSFSDLAAWEAWLSAQPRDSKGLWLMLAKAGNADSALTKAQAIDGALCHGWIDGQLDSFDHAWFLTRFTSRKARSKWSEKNSKRAEALLEEGRIAAAGRAEIEAAKADGRWDATYAPASTATEPNDLRAALDADPGARAFYDTLTGANRYAISIVSRPRRRPRRVPHGSRSS